MSRLPSGGSASTACRSTSRVLAKLRLLALVATLLVVIAVVLVVVFWSEIGPIVDVLIETGPGD